MGFCDFGPPGNVVRMAVAACLWPTTFKIPSVQGSRNYMVQNEPELHGFRKVVVVGSRRFSIRSFLEKIL